MENNEEIYQDTEMQDPPVKKLYDGLFKTQRYTKSFDEFKTQYSTKESIAKLHTGLSNSKSYTKGEDEFVNQYFPEVKKKEDLPLQPLDGQSSLPKSENVAPNQDEVIQPKEESRQFLFDGNIKDKKKKVGTINYDASSLETGNNLPVTEDKKNPFELVGQLNNLSKETKAIVGGGGTGGAGVSFTQTEEALGKSKLVKEELAKQGVKDKDIAEITNEISDLSPSVQNFKKQNEDGTVSYPYSLKSLGELYAKDYIAYKTKINAVKTYDAIRNAVGTEKANQFSLLQNQNQKQLSKNLDIEDFVIKKGKQKKLIMESLKGDELDIALQRLDENSALIIDNAIPSHKEAEVYLTNRLNQSEGKLTKNNLSISDLLLDDGKSEFDGNLGGFNLSSIEARLDNNNPADRIAFQKYKKFVNTKEALNTSLNLDEAAINLAKLQDEHFASTVKVLEAGGEKIPNSYKGKKVFEFLSDPYIIELAQTNSNFGKEYKKTAQNLYFNYPDFAKTEIGNIISQAREDNGLNNWFANVPTKNETDELVNQLVFNQSIPEEKRTIKGTMTELQKNIYLRDIAPELGVGKSIVRGFGHILAPAFTENSPIATPGLIDRAGEGWDNTMGGVYSSLKTLSRIAPSTNLTRIIQPKEEVAMDLYNALEKENEMISVKPKGILHEASAASGDFIPLVVSMAVGGSLLKGAGKMGEAINMAIQFAGHNAERGLVAFPDSPLKQKMYTGAATTIDMFLGRLLPHNKALSEEISNSLHKNVTTAITDFASGKITANTAKKTLLSTIEDIVNKKVPEIFKKNVETGLIMSAFSASHSGLDIAFGAKPSQSIEDFAAETAEAFKTGFLGNTLVAGAMAFKNTSTVKENLLKASVNPKVYKDLIIEQSLKSPEIATQKEEMFANIDAAVEARGVAESKGMNEKQTSNFVLLHVNQKIQENIAKNATVDLVKEEATKKAKELKEQKEKVFKGIDETDTKLSVPIEGVNEQGVPIGENVPPPTKQSESNTALRDVEDAEYNDFIDKGKVTPERLNDIAQKVKDNKKLSDREMEIFSDKTSDINKIIASESLLSKEQPSQKGSVEVVGSVEEPSIVVHGTINGYGLQYSEGKDAKDIVEPLDPRMGTMEQRIELNKGNAIVIKDEVNSNGGKDVSVNTPMTDSFGRGGGAVYELSIPKGNKATAEGIKKIVQENHKKSSKSGKELINETVGLVKDYINSNKAVEQSLPTQAESKGSGVGGDVKSINKAREEELRKNVYSYNDNIERLSLGDDMAILRDNAKEDLKDQRKSLQRSVDMYEKDLSEMDKKDELYDHTKQNLEYWKGELKKWDDINADYDAKIKEVEQSPTQEVKDKVVGSGVGGDVDFTAKGGNKAVDEKGEPLVLWQGGTKGKYSVYATKDKNVAEHFGQDGNVRKVNVSLKKPFVIDFVQSPFNVEIGELGLTKEEQFKIVKEAFGNEYKSLDDYFNHEYRSPIAIEDVQAFIQKRGINDGIIIKDIYEGESVDMPTSDYIVFDKSQIKSAEQSLQTPEVKDKVVGSDVVGDMETKQQIENFGVPKKDVESVNSVISQVFNGLKKAGLTAAKTVSDWVGIGKGGVEKPYTLKMNGKDVQVKNVQPEVVNGFYSPLEKIITDSKFDKLPTKQWIEKYANSEEAQFTGLKDWLAQQEGSVSKADIQQYLKDNRIEIKEIVKGIPENPNLEGFKIWAKTNGYTTDDATLENVWKIGKADLVEDYLKDNTKFSQYQLEGEKENYKEVLVMLPNQKDISVKIVKSGDGYVIEKGGVPVSPLFYSKEQAETNLNSYTRKEDEFKSSHFDEPNILVHLRMNTRTDAEGNKVAFVEEFQSDWGKEGRTKGFDEKYKENEVTVLDQNSPEANEPNLFWYFKVPNNVLQIPKSRYKTIEEAKAYVVNDKKKIDSGIPQAPFVTDTNAWTKLGLKVALKEAVKQGADKIAWTTGEQQNDRYDLSKQVDYVDYWRNENGTYGFSLPIEFTKPSKLTASELENYLGKEVAKKIVDNSEPKIATEESELTTSVAENFIKDRKDVFYEINGIRTGKVKSLDHINELKYEHRSKVQFFGEIKYIDYPKENNPNRLENNDLKVGGKGMKGFYGSPTEGSLGIVGNVAKSLFKQEPKTVELQTTSTGIASQDKVLRLRDWVQKNKNEDYSYNDAQKDINNNSKLYQEYQKNIPTQHSIDITPELKASVEGGQPLFKTEESKKEFGGFETRDGKPIGFTYDTEKVARERFDISKLKKIGSGSDRDVYDLGNGKVLKIAKTARGLTQNIYEGDYYLTSVVPEVTERGLNYVVADNAPRLKSADVIDIYDPETNNQVGKSTAGQMLRDLSKFTQKDFDNKTSELQDVLGKYGLQDITSYEVLWNDFKAPRNWGYKDGVAYHSDGGTFGGLDMIDSYKGKTNMSDPEFRKIYEESKRLKKQFGDTDKATMYSKDGGKIEAQYRIENGKNIVEAIKDFNGSQRATVALTHEIMHPTVVAIINGAKEGNEVGAKHTETIVNEFNKVTGQKVTIEDLIKGNDAFKDGTTSKQYRAIQEFIAKSWEKYHTEGGKGFSTEFQKVLEQITQAFKAVYNSLTKKQLTPELSKMFDEILGKETTKAEQSLTTKNKEKVKELEKLREDEQLELDAKIPNAEQYRVDGKVDRNELTNEKDIKAFDEVYSKYDKLITPLLKEIDNKNQVIEKKNTGTEIEPVLEEGRKSVTLSGNTEAERQLYIEQRKKETKQTPMTSDRDKILNRIAKFNNLTKPQKRNAYQEANNIKLAVDSFNEKHQQKHKISKISSGDLELRGNPSAKKSFGNKLKNTLKGEEKNIIENGKPLMERDYKTKKVFNDLLDADVLPVSRRVNGEKMSEVEHDGTIQDIIDGIPSERAENYLNRLENQIKEDSFDYGNPDKNAAPVTLRDALSITVEASEPMSMEMVEKWLKDESEMTPEGEILFDNIDNLITHYEQLYESGISSKVQQPNQAGKGTSSREVKQNEQKKGKDASDNKSEEVKYEEAKKAKVVNEASNEGTSRGNEPITPKKDSTTKENVGEDTQGTGGGKEPPKEPIENDFLYSPNEQKRTSGLMKHLLEAKNIDESIKKEIKDKGLDKYEVANNAEAREVASQIVKSLDKDGALQIARMEDMHPSVRSAIYAEVIDNAFKLEQEAIKSGNKDAQMEAAAEWASVSKEYDKKLTSGGQFTAYAAHFYKQSPLGFVIKANESISKKFEDWAKDKDTDLKEVFKLITETEQGESLINKKVEELRKKERKAERKKRDKNIDDFFDGLKAKNDILYSAIIPPSVWNGAMDVLKVATKGGDRVVDAVQKAIEHITKNIGDDWDKERFRKEYEQKVLNIADAGVKEKSYEQVLRDRAIELKRRLNENDFSSEEYKDKKELSEKEKIALEDLKEVQDAYNEAKKKSPQYIDKKSKQYLDMVRGRLNKMDEKQKEDFIRRVSKKIIENGGLKYEEFRQELADVMGFKELTPEQVKRAEELTNNINVLNDIENKMVEERTVQSKLNYIEAQNKAAEAQNELFNMVAKKTDVINTFKSWYTGSLMGVQSLFINTLFNPIQQLTVRLPKSVLLNIGERGAKAISLAMNKLTGSPIYNPKLNILDAQKGYFGSFKPAINNAWFNFKKGTENRDLFGKNEYQTSLSPKIAASELAKFKKGEIYLTPMEVIDRKIRKSIFARQADLILRGMQFGDVVPRWMAEGAKSIQIAKNELDITDVVDLDIFMHSPEKMAKQILLKQGKSELQASKLAAEIKERIVFEGEKAVMQQPNLLKNISSGLDKGLTIKEKDELGMKTAKTSGSVLKTLTFPFIGIPANLAWEGFKLINPEISLGLSISQAAQAAYKAKKGDAAGAKKFFEMSKDNFAHSVLGATYLIAASTLVNAGLTASSNDEEVSAKERAGESTYGKQNQFNMGKAMGGTDFWVDNKFLGLFGTMLNVKSKQKDEILKKGAKAEVEDNSWVQDFSERVGYGGISQLNNLIFNNGAKIVSAINGGDAPFKMWMSQTTNGLSSLFTGGTYTSFSKAMLPEQVTLKGDGIVSEIIESQKQKNILLRLSIDMFGGNGTPKSKISIWGEPIKNDRSVTGVLGNMLGWEKGNQDIFGAIIYGDYRRTGNVNFFPMPDDDKFLVNGEQVKLNKEQKFDLDVFVGQARKTFAKAVVYDMTKKYGGKVYSDLDDNEKIEALQTSYELAKEIGYANFIKKYPQFEKVKKTEEKYSKEMEKKYKKQELENELKSIDNKSASW